MLKVSAFYLEKQKRFFPEKLFFWPSSLNMPRKIQKMAFAVLIFSEGFDKGDDFVVLDGFHAPPIESGVGTAQASIFLDGNHTRVRTYSIV